MAALSERCAAQREDRGHHATGRLMLHRELSTKGLGDMKAATTLSFRRALPHAADTEAVPVVNHA
jgi:hypothetical protein